MVRAAIFACHQDARKVQHLAISPIVAQAICILRVGYDAQINAISECVVAIKIRKRFVYKAFCNFAAYKVFSSKQATVIGPVPPGIGVIAPATVCT